MWAESRAFYCHFYVKMETAVSIFCQLDVLMCVHSCCVFYKLFNIFTKG